MFEKIEISKVPHGSVVRVELDGKLLVGTNHRNLRDEDKVYIYATGQSIKLPPDKEVEILRRGGFQLEITTGN